MAEVKPAEVSAILKQQLAGFDASASLDEVGTVLTVGDGIVRAYGLSNVQYGELVEFGLIKPDGQDYFSVTASAVVNLAVTLRSYGLEPRHLKTVLSSASREVDLFAPLVKSAAASKGVTASAQAQELTLQLANSITALHGLLIREVIERQK